MCLIYLRKSLDIHMIREKYLGEIHAFLFTYAIKYHVLRQKFATSFHTVP